MAKRSIAGWIVIVCCFFLGQPLPASAQDDDSPEPLATEQDAQFTLSNPVLVNSPWAVDSFAQHGGNVQWSAFQGTFLTGEHDLLLTGGLTSWQDRLNFGGDLSTGQFSSTLTYRYNGIFGGMVRPVARFTAGAGQWYDQVNGPGFLGYGDGWTAFARPEAGLEFVYAGYGLGVTVSYVKTYDTYQLIMMHDDKYTGGPFAPQPGHNNLDQWLLNIYPIIEK